MEVSTEREDLENRVNNLQREAEQIPMLKQQVLAARNTRNAELAKYLGIPDWDETMAPEDQDRIIKGRINEIFKDGFTDAQSLKKAEEFVLACIEAEIAMVQLDVNNPTIEENTKKLCWNICIPFQTR